jgi:hypothetical protein
MSLISTLQKSTVIIKHITPTVLEFNHIKLNHTNALSNVLRPTPKA